MNFHKIYLMNRPALTFITQRQIRIKFASLQLIQPVTFAFCLVAILVMILSMVMLPARFCSCEDIWRWSCCRFRWQVEFCVRNLHKNSAFTHENRQGGQKQFGKTRKEKGEKMNLFVFALFFPQPTPEKFQFILVCYFCVCLCIFCRLFADDGYGEGKRKRIFHFE